LSPKSECKNIGNFTTLLKPHNTGTHLKGIETSFQVVPWFVKSIHFWVSCITFSNISQNTFSLWVKLIWGGMAKFVQHQLKHWENFILNKANFLYAIFFSHHFIASNAIKTLTKTLPQKSVKSKISLKITLILYVEFPLLNYSCHDKKIMRRWYRHNCHRSFSD
jgi:hypothetical protein